MMKMAPPREGRSWPAYLFGGRLRTSTAALLIAFCAIWWLYEVYEPAATPPSQVPASEVVPPGFIPDPAYTWAPRTDVRRSETTTSETTSTTPTTSTTETTPTTPAATTETSVPAESGTPKPTSTSSSPTASPASSPAPGPSTTPRAAPTPTASGGGGALAPVPPAQ